MKKLLLMSFGAVGLCAVEAQATPSYTTVNVSPFKMAKTHQKSDASMIQFDQRRVNAMVQKTAVYARDGIIAVLAAAENEGFGTVTGDTGYNQIGAGVGNLRKVAEESFIGLHNDGSPATSSIKIAATGEIQFVMDPSEIDKSIGIGKFSITYYPVTVASGAEGSYTGTTDKYIDGWTCVTTASTETRLGRGHVAHSEDTVEPLFMGLGYPFELCTIVNDTPSVTNLD